MHFLYLVRIVTVVIAVAHTLSSIPPNARSWLEERLTQASVIYEYGYSTFIFAGEIGAFIAAVIAVFLAFFAIPRFTWGASALSWCFLAMGICLLPRLEMGYWDRYLSIVIQIIGYASPFNAALPPLVIGLLLRYSFVQKGLYHDRIANV